MPLTASRAYFNPLTKTKATKVGFFLELLVKTMKYNELKSLRRLFKPATLYINILGNSPPDVATGNK